MAVICDFMTAIFFLFSSIGPKFFLCKLILKPILTDLGSSNLFFREKGEEGPVLTYLKPGFGSSECSF